MIGGAGSPIARGSSSYRRLNTEEPAIQVRFAGTADAVSPTDGTLVYCDCNRRQNIGVRVLVIAPGSDTHRRTTTAVGFHEHREDAARQGDTGTHFRVAKGG